MKKLDLLRAVSAETGVLQKDVKLITDSVFKNLKKGIHERGIYSIQGFGTIKIKHYGERVCRNPKTGESVIAKPRSFISFLMARSTLDKKLNGKI